MTEPWERQPQETAKAFAAFVAYRDTPPSKRSHKELAQTFGKSTRLIARWSTNWRWVERVTAWDAELDRLKRAKQIEAIQEMAERHATIALMYQQRILERLPEIDASLLGPRDLAAWLEVSTKVEREARGAPTKLELSGKLELQKTMRELSEDDLYHIAASGSPGAVTADKGTS